MHQNLRIFLCKSFSNYHLRSTSIPISSFLLQIPKSSSNQSISDPPPLTKLNTSCPPISKFHHFVHPNRLNLSTQFRKHEESREFSSESDAGVFDQGKEIDEINLKFAEAREEIEMALESKETVYFDEEAEAARAAVKAVLEMFESLSAKLPEGERASLQRSMGLKIEQLKAELEQLND
ncbi:embryogenesis-like protein [Magnolia sinica]|uniref:embryogenesis-like protein n=1 Tax=Magnolia sinica TaxID=86752 RepID=UPI00265B6FCE|nr:embryogenesis-like protein [Magnolia sinica]XP_058111047.1 embryogenesis-like protein [Magnolia sinica]